MAEGFLKSFDPEVEVHSAGTDPAPLTHPLAVAAMEEIGIDISEGVPKNVDQFIDEPFDYVVTVCGNAQETCPAFRGEVREILHIGFDDPAAARGTHEEVMSEFRRIRDEIRDGFRDFYEKKVQGGK
jgi:arsenate reductase